MTSPSRRTPEESQAIPRSNAEMKALINQQREEHLKNVNNIQIMRNIRDERLERRVPPRRGSAPDTANSMILVILCKKENKKNINIFAFIFVCALKILIKFSNNTPPQYGIRSLK